MRKKSESSSANTPGSTARLLRPIWIYALSACLGTLVIALVLNLLQARANNTQQLEVASQQMVQAHAAALAGFIATQQTYLQFLAAQADVVNALQDEGTEPELRALETKYREAYSYASRFSIVPLTSMGTAALEFPQHRLNSIETAMIIDAVRGKAVNPEAYKEDGRSVITLLYRVGEAPEAIRGALLLSLDSKAINRVLTQIGANQGQLTLQQSFRNDQQTVFQTGSAAESAPQVSAPVPGISNWQLVFQPSAETVAASTNSAVLAWILLGVASAALLAAGVWIYSRLRNQLDSEFAELREYLAQLKGGERALPPALSLAQFTEIGALGFDLSQMAPISGKPSSADAEAAAELSEKMVGKSASKVTAAVEDDYVDEAEEPAAEEAPAAELPPVAPGIFRAYDIRGIVGEDLTADTVYQIGLAIGSEALDQGQQAVIVGRDGRLSSEELASQLARGLQDSGTDVIDLGLVPTPILYFATQQLNTASGVMVTGSHNPPQYNGLKVVINGKTLSEDGITNLNRRIDEGRLHSGSGIYSTADIGAQYIDYVLGDIAVAQPLKVVLDCGNGVAGILAPRLFEELGCEVVPLYCEVDGNFPNHHPDPSVPENLADLVTQVREHSADLGIAFDGDGDRLAVVTARGDIVAADRLLMLFAQDVVSRNPGCDVIFDVKCTRHLNDVIASYGGRPIMWKSGHSLIKQKMVETGALLGGEFSGHIFFKERWFGFDDGLYSAARLIEIMSTTNPDLDQLLEQFPNPCGTPEIQVQVGDERKFAIVENFAGAADFGDARISQIDGVRVDLPDGWGLLRASNTTPNLVLRFEAESEQALDGIKQQFQQQLQQLEPDISF